MSSLYLVSCLNVKSSKQQLCLLLDKSLSSGLRDLFCWHSSPGWLFVRWIALSSLWTTGADVQAKRLCSLNWAVWRRNHTLTFLTAKGQRQSPSELVLETPGKFLILRISPLFPGDFGGRGFNWQAHLLNLCSLTPSAFSACLSQWKLLTRLR